MFRNCRDYNEEGSMIYEDANTLERILMEHVKDPTAVEKKIPAKKLVHKNHFLNFF